MTGRKNQDNGESLHTICSRIAAINRKSVTRGVHTVSKVRTAELRIGLMKGLPDVEGYNYGYDFQRQEVQLLTDTAHPRVVYPKPNGLSRTSGNFRRTRSDDPDRSVYSMRLKGSY